MQLINLEQLWVVLIAVCAAIAACVAGGDAREKRGSAQRLA
jgi:hypothetical protein